MCIVYYVWFAASAQRINEWMNSVGFCVYNGTSLCARRRYMSPKRLSRATFGIVGVEILQVKCHP